MKTARMRLEINAGIEAVWRKVTDNSDWSWRSGIERLEICGDGQWREYYSGGNFTEFKVTEMEPERRYVFEMENKMFRGRWIGVFENIQGTKTMLDMTEEIQVKNPIMRFIAMFAWDLNKLQRQYADDLKKALKIEQ